METAVGTFWSAFTGKHTRWVFPFTFKRIQTGGKRKFSRYIFLKLHYQSMKPGAMFYVGFYRKMYRENFRLPPVCIRLNVKGKTQRVCLPVKADQNAPTAVSIMYQKECQLNVCQPLLIR